MIGNPNPFILLARSKIDPSFGFSFIIQFIGCEQFLQEPALHKVAPIQYTVEINSVADVDDTKKLASWL